MKNVGFITFLVMLFLWSCKSGTVEDVNINTTDITVEADFSELDTSDMQSISLLDYDLNLSIKVPIVATAAGAEIQPEIMHDDGDYLWYIKIGEYFNLVIEDYANEFGKVLKHQRDLEGQSNVFKITYIEKSSNLIFYKRELINENGGLPTYHCYSEIEIDGYNYVLRTESFGGYELVVKDMVLSIKTAKPVMQS
ncbi:MAG: hypothetical protein AB8B72_09155 [Crocinitomicaceae bacterium]